MAVDVAAVVVAVVVGVLDGGGSLAERSPRSPYDARYTISWASSLAESEHVRTCSTLLDARRSTRGLSLMRSDSSNSL